ncbi:MAG TPA: histidine-type phosphatase [Candidatus Mailhella merdavium]|nr:histidine-type phosphatase [Candidatus Mailhella merdavium]
MFKLIGLLFLALVTVPGVSMADTLRDNAPENGRLLRLVVLSRHGVRSPTQSPEELAKWASRPWPQWPVGRGELTVRGGELLTIQWEQVRRMLAEEGLLPEQGCPAPEDIRCIADAEQRTRKSAEAILKGLVPGCNISVDSDPDKVTPLFHPVKAGQAHLDAQASRTSLKQKLDTLSVPPDAMELIQKVTGCCSSRMCGSEVRNCTLAALPDTVGFEKGDVKLNGRLAIASSLAEIFLLEYGQWPDQNAGWGEVDAAALKTMLPVHNIVFDALNRDPVIAAARGGAMLRAIRDSLTQDQARIVIYAGHDTNIANVGGLLNLNWDIPDQGHNSIPPGGALLFSLWETAPDTQEIRAFFLSPTLETLHAKTPAAQPLVLDAGLLCNGSPCTPEAFSLLTDGKQPR